jgi:hypothetical protein
MGGREELEACPDPAPRASAWSVEWALLSRASFAAGGAPIVLDALIRQLELPPPADGGVCELRPGMSGNARKAGRGDA